MEVKDKYLKLLGKHIYNKKLNKFGHISSLNVTHYIGGYYIGFEVFYDTFDSNNFVNFEDFINKDIQFAIITDYEDSFNNQVLQDIQEIFGDSFNNNMIIYIKEEDRQKNNQKVNQENVQMLCKDLISLNKISAKVVAEDFYSRELYIKYKQNIVTKEELLYALINYFCNKIKELEDKNLDYFTKYELCKEDFFTC